MQTKRKTIGRTLGAVLTYPVAETEPEQRFILKSGKTAVFHFVHVPADELEAQTFVCFSVNGRDQNALTPESLTDITRTLKLQQFFPAIGYRNNGKIEILDGSRRRAAALLCHVGLNVLVTENIISNDDARQLAADIQTAKEHNLREIGLRLLKLRDEGMTQKEIAFSEQLSAAKVTRAIQAASVPDDIISLFPVQSELTHSDYKILLIIDKLITANNLPRDMLLSDMNKKIHTLTGKGKVAPDELKKAILSELKMLTDLLTQKAKSEAVSVITLREFSDKNMYARKRVKGRGFSYEFNRLPKSLQSELDKGVQSIIKQYYSGEHTD
ncbi:ParB family protein [Morganella morganii]|uniref:ParB family protein n=1 Tax=Morganella morganii TaxID=582 RepID=UPI0032D9E84B